MKPSVRWGPSDWKRLPAWAVDLERQRWIDGRRVTRAVNERPVMWWVMPPWQEVSRDAVNRIGEALG